MNGRAVTVGMDDFAASYGDTTVVVDVREPQEYAEGHVPGALLIPLAQVADRILEVPAADRVYVICRSGRRSQVAAEALRRAGISAVSVDEGTLGWAERGRPVVTGPAPR